MGEKEVIFIGDDSMFQDLKGRGHTIAEDGVKYISLLIRMKGCLRNEAV